jgi:hypothetical protein
MDPRIDTLTNCPELALILAQCRIEHGIDTLTIGQKISPPGKNWWGDRPKPGIKNLTQ